MTLPTECPACLVGPETDLQAFRNAWINWRLCPEHEEAYFSEDPQQIAHDDNMRLEDTHDGR